MPPGDVIVRRGSYYQQEVSAVITVESTEFHNDFGRYLQAVQDGEEIMILKNGKEVARLIPPQKDVTMIVSQLRGILKNKADIDIKDIREERLKKYENTDQ